MREDPDELNRFERGPRVEEGVGGCESDVGEDGMSSVIGSEFEGEVDWVEVPEDATEVDLERVGVVCFSKGDSKVLKGKSRGKGSESGWSLIGSEGGRGAVVYEGLRGSDVEVERVNLGGCEERVEARVRGEGGDLRGG